MSAFQTRLSAERYLANKQYFDNGLIAALEACQLQIDKLKSVIEIKNAMIYKKNLAIKTIRIQNKNHKSTIHALKAALKSSNLDAEEQLKELEKSLEDMKKVIDKELQKSYEDNAKLNDENQRLRKQLDKMRKLLNGKINTNSTNSSKPSSTDGFFVKPSNMRKKSERKIGGQKGHPGHFSTMSDKTTTIIEKHVNEVPSKAEAVSDDKGNILYYRTQEIDFNLVTSVCEIRYFLDGKGTLSEEDKKRFAINSVVYTPNFKANLLYLNHQGTIALDRLCKMVNEMSQGKITLKPSTLAKWTKEFYKKAKPIQEEIIAQIQKAPLNHVDESGYRINGKISWIHTISNADYTYYTVTSKRGDTERGPLKLLEHYNGILMHDHFKSYLKLRCKHAECNAHILRYLKSGWDNDNEVQCQNLIQLMQEMLHRKNEKIEAGILQMSAEEVAAYEKRYEEIIDVTVKKYYGSHPNQKRKYVPNYIKTMERMKEYKEAHLRFLHDFSVPFDNNEAERQIRMVKNKLKISGQSKSLETANAYACVLTIIQTAKKQQLNILETMKNILAAKDVLFFR